jgi:uncharacterized protein (TIGR00299 family) protein
MKILYCDCFSGVSGDMLLGALTELGYDVKKALARLKLPKHRIEITKVKKLGISATQVRVIYPHHHGHHGLKDIQTVLRRCGADRDIREKAGAVYAELAKAEAKMHGVKPGKARFHEIGDVDSLVDVLGTLTGIKTLGIEKVFASPLNVGTGFVKCAHGLLPVPAPATAELLRHIPIYSTDTQKEIVTPTGAVLIKNLAQSFGPMPSMTVQKIGYGAGEADLAHPNVLRVFYGESTAPSEALADSVDVLEANIDDMNPEYYDSVMEALFREGALDVTLTPMMMKKNRPAIQLTVLCGPEKTQRLSETIFTQTTTFGIRIHRVHRQKLSVEKMTVKTRYGKISLKIGRLGDRVMNVSPEYEDCKRAALLKGAPVKAVYDEARRLGGYPPGSRGRTSGK